MLTLLDIRGVLVSVLAAGLVVAAPGYALGRLFRLGGNAGRDEVWAEVLTGLVVGLAVLPILDSLMIRGLGLNAAIVLNLGLAVGGATCRTRAPTGRRWPRPSTLSVLLLIAWLAVVLVETVDFDGPGGRLYQPFTVVDMVKHAAVTQAVHDGGAPPRDPFFLRSERASYYYFFYSLSALTERMGLGLVDARAAVAGLVFWTGLGLYGLLRLAIAACGEANSTGALLRVLILAAGGLDILGVLRLGLLQHVWLADPVVWNEQITGWVESLLWVPHHVTGMIAAFLGLITLAKAISPAPCRRGMAGRAAAIVLPALCFASTFGLSIWVSLVLGATVVTWGLALLWERRWRALNLVAATAAMTILLALPQMIDLIAGRAVLAGPPAIVASVRVFTPVDGLVPAGVWRQMARLLVLPLNYYAAFGVLASGSLLYWRDRRSEPAFRTEFARVLALAAIAGLLLGGFLRSTLFNNDLGWRVVLFPLLAGTVWTIHAVGRRTAEAPAQTSLPPLLVATFVLGWMTTLYGLVSLRAYPILPVEADDRFVAAHPRTERSLRLAYAWADRNLPRDAVLQHDPTRPRAFAFALYGRHPIAVADSFGSLFGADPNAVDARIESLAPIFREPLSQSRIAALAAANAIDDFVVTRDDPIWARPDSFVWRVTPVYASDDVRIIPRAGLEQIPNRQIPPKHG